MIMSQYLGQEKRSKWNIDYYALIYSLEINIREKIFSFDKPSQSFSQQTRTGQDGCL